MRKKTVSLIVVLTFLMTLFPLALPAFAADYTRLGAVASVDDDDWAQLNRVKVETSEGEVRKDDVVIVSLPSDFDFDWDQIEGPGTSLSGTDAGLIDVEVLDTNELKLTANADFSTTDEGLFYIDLDWVYVDDGYEGDIPLKFKAPSGSGFDNGEVVVGRVTGGEVTVEVVEDETFSDDGGEVTIRMEEDRAGAFENDPESVKFILPKGFEWDSVYDVKVIYGDDIYSETDFNVDGDELIFNAGSGTSSATLVEFTAWIDIEDEDDAKYGDVVAKVRGESDVTPSTIVVGAYGDYSVDVTADDPTTVYAGYVEQEIADFTIEEGIDDSLISGRSITLTLPDWAKWGAVPDEVEDGVELRLQSAPGKDGQTVKYQIYNSGYDAAELEFEDMEVVLSPDAPEGDLEVEIGGTATVSTTIKVADVKKPVAVTAGDSPTIVIGRAGQGIAELTLTEAEAGLINEGENLILELPKGIEWDSYEVEVVEGDLEIGDVDDYDEELVIEIDDESDDAAVIKVTGSVTAYRTVPEGSVKVDVGGFAVIEVNDPEKIEDQYTTAYIYDDAIWVDGYWDDVLLIDDYDEDDFDGLWKDKDTIASEEVAWVGTPAPGETKITAVFTLGSTTYLLNDIPQTMDVAPYAKNGRTYLPMRFVAKALGIPDSGILWNKGTATFISGDRVVSVTIGSNVMYINGAAVVIDAAPEIANGRTMLPIRWIATAFGVNVSWDAATQQVTVN